MRSCCKNGSSRTLKNGEERFWMIERNLFQDWNKSLCKFFIEGFKSCQKEFNFEGLTWICQCESNIAKWKVSQLCFILPRIIQYQIGTIFRVQVTLLKLQTVHPAKVTGIVIAKNEIGNSVYQCGEGKPKLLLRKLNLGKSYEKVFEKSTEVINQKVSVTKKRVN